MATQTLTPITPEKLKELIEKAIYKQVLNYTGFDAELSYADILILLKLRNEAVSSHIIKNLTKMRDTRSIHLIHFASEFGFNEQIQMFLDVGVDINTVGPDGWSCIHYTLRYDKVDTLRFLLKKGFSIESKTPYGHTPLCLAIHFQAVECIKALIELGANVNVAINNGLRPIVMATTGEIESSGIRRTIPFNMANSYSIVEMLLKANADIVYHEGDAVIEIIAKDDPHLMKILVKNISQAQWNFPRKVSKMRCDLISKIISKHKITVESVKTSITNLGTLSYLQIAAAMGNVEMCRILIDNGANVNDLYPDATKGYRMSPLCLAVITSNIILAKMLIDRGADINLIPKGGMSSFDKAVEIGNKLLINMLLTKGAQPSIPGRKPSIEYTKDQSIKDLITTYEKYHPAPIVKSIDVPEKSGQKLEVKDLRDRKKGNRSCFSMFWIPLD